MYINFLVCNLILALGVCYKQTSKQTNKQTHKQTHRQTDRQNTDRQTDGRTDRQTDRQTNKQRDKQTNRQTDEQTHRQTDRDLIYTISYPVSYIKYHVSLHIHRYQISYIHIIYNMQIPYIPFFSASSYRPPTSPGRPPHQLRQLTEAQRETRMEHCHTLGEATIVTSEPKPSIWREKLLLMATRNPGSTHQLRER